MIRDAMFFDLLRQLYFPLLLPLPPKNDILKRKVSAGRYRCLNKEILLSEDTITRIAHTAGE